MTNRIKDYLEDHYPPKTSANDEWTEIRLNILEEKAMAAERANLVSLAIATVALLIAVLSW